MFIHSITRRKQDGYVWTPEVAPQQKHSFTPGGGGKKAFLLISAYLKHIFKISEQLQE